MRTHGSKMHVASAKLILDYYGNQSAKTKSEELQKLFTETRRKFSILIEEVEDFDDPERCVMGLCFVTSSRSGAQSKLRRVLDYIDQMAFARVVMSDGQVEPFELAKSEEDFAEDDF